jgi:hypothetical protein
MYGFYFQPVAALKLTRTMQHYVDSAARRQPLSSLAGRDHPPVPCSRLVFGEHATFRQLSLSHLKVGSCTNANAPYQPRAMMRAAVNRHIASTVVYVTCKK